MSQKDLSFVKKLKINLNNAVYQAILSKDETTLAHRVIEYKTINKDLENLFVNNNGFIIIE